MNSETKSTPDTWTRRQFVRGAAGMVALPHLVDAHASSLNGTRQIAYVASGSNAISVFAERGNRWSLVQQLASQAPAYLLLSPALPVLYVANDVATQDGVARGAIETFSIDRVDGKLTLMGRNPLSLSAAHPRHLALSPDGNLLAVGAFGGGIYNLLPVAGDGRLGVPRGIFKDIGCGPHVTLQTSAHPHTLVFDNDGKHFLSTDFGCDRISIFAVQDGRLTRKALLATGAGTGPGGCVLHPAGFLYASHELADTLVSYRYHAVAGAVFEIARQPGSAGCLVLHPAGHCLYGAQSRSSTLRVWRVDAQSGRLTLAQHLSLEQTIPTQISVAPDGNSVYVLDEAQESILKFSADPASGELTAQDKRAHVKTPRSIALRMI